MSPTLRDRCTVVDGWPAFAAAVVDVLTVPPVPAATATAALEPARVYRRLGDTLHTMVAGRHPRVAGPRPTGRMLTLFAQHGNRAYPGALAELQRLMAERLPGVQHDLLVVDNSLTRPPRSVWRRPVARDRHTMSMRSDHSAAARTGRRPRVVQGSNTSGEFSAWDDGIAAVGEALDSYDAIALVTSAFQRYDAMRHLSLLNPAMVAAVRDQRVALGHIDCFDEPVWLDDVVVQSWARSSFVLLAPGELRGLGTVVGVDGDLRARLFNDDPSHPFADAAPLSDGLRALLLGWITGEGTGQGVTWHSRFDLTADTMPRFRAKATAILDELLLTHRLRVQGCEVFDLRTYADA